MVEVYKCLNNISPPFKWDYFKEQNNPHTHESPSRNRVKGSILWNKLPNHFTSLCISKIKFRNGQEGHVLVVSGLKLLPFKKYTYVKKN